jgi:hypothetical protein
MPSALENPSFHRGDLKNIKPHLGISTCCRVAGTDSRSCCDLATSFIESKCKMGREEKVLLSRFLRDGDIEGELLGRDDDRRRG